VPGCLWIGRGCGWRLVAATATGEVGKSTAFSTVPNAAAVPKKLVAHLRRAGSGPMKFCHDAGPCCYASTASSPRLEAFLVVAPSTIPRKSGERQKNDKRDAANLAVLHRGGLVTAVCMPDAAHEAMRAAPAIDCVSAASRADLSRWPDAWTKAHRGWLADQNFSHPAQQIVPEESIEAVRLDEQRQNRAEGHLRAQIPTLSLFPWSRTCVRSATWT
jgi:transposase